MTTYYEDAVNCDGSDSTIVSNLQCTIPMSTLIATPYFLTLGDLIVVKISAHNANGWGAESTPNAFGTTIRTVPVAMNSPLRGDETSES